MEMLDDLVSSFFQFPYSIAAKCPGKFFQCILFFGRKMGLAADLSQFFLRLRNFQIIGFLDIGIVKCGQDSPADTAFLDKMTNSERAHLLIQIGRMFRDVELDPFFLHA